MGIICLNKEMRHQISVNKEISGLLKQERLQAFRHIKLLLLGPGESGKSTVLKQMQILHKNGFTDAQLNEFKALIYSNTLQCMALLINAMKQLNISLDDLELELIQLFLHFFFHVHSNKVQKAAESDDRKPFSIDLYTALRKLWADKGIRQCYEKKEKIQLPDCAKHFLDNLDRIYEADYRPTNEDILFARVATTGVVEVDFDLQETQFHVYDVGGQKSERRKWIHCFDNVSAVIFICAVSEYDQTLRENETINRMIDTLQLFASICNSEYFLDTTFILFLNKRDLFAEKIQSVPITVIFPQYTGPRTYDTSIEYIKMKFRELNVNPSKALVMHETCATDTNQVQHVINGVIDTVIAKNLSVAGVF